MCFWTWKLERWTCHSSIKLVFLKLGLRPTFILDKKFCLFLDLEAGTLDLSLQHWTCLLEAGPKKFCLSWTWKLGHWTCHSSIGLVFLKLGLRPSFIPNKKLCLFLDLEAGALDLSLQHWTCLFEAGPSAQLHS